jgi:hypothetical protein
MHVKSVDLITSVANHRVSSSELKSRVSSCQTNKYEPLPTRNSKFRFRVRIYKEVEVGAAD